jgi:hypothetical protein
MDKLELINKIKKIAKKPKLHNVRISKVEKKRKRIIINNPKEFSDKYLYL